MNEQTPLSGSGTLTVTVNTAGGALPIENALVEIFGEEGKMHFSALSGRSGETPVFPLPAPALSSPCALFASEEKREESAPLSPAEK